MSIHIWETPYPGMYNRIEQVNFTHPIFQLIAGYMYFCILYVHGLMYFYGRKHHCVTLYLQICDGRHFVTNFLQLDIRKSFKLVHIKVQQVLQFSHADLCLHMAFSWQPHKYSLYWNNAIYKLICYYVIMQFIYKMKSRITNE